jgi:hypothetical protein
MNLKTSKRKLKVHTDELLNAPLFGSPACSDCYMKQLTELQKENIRLKRMYDTLLMDHQILRQTILRKIDRMTKNTKEAYSKKG